MKTLLFLTLTFVAGVVASAQTNVFTAPGKNAARPYGFDNFAVPFAGNSEAWDYQKSYVTADVMINPVVDTLDAALADSTWITYYGKLWSTVSTDSLPNMFIVGRDSSYWRIAYRWVGHSANTWGAGPWTFLANVTLTNPPGVLSTFSEGDTLVQVKKVVANWPLQESGYIQFKYMIKSTKALTVPTRYRARQQARAGATFQSFGGEVDLIWRRSSR